MEGKGNEEEMAALAEEIAACKARAVAFKKEVNLWWHSVCVCLCMG